MSDKNVRVFCRFRPLNRNEITNGSKKTVRIDNNTSVCIQTENKTDNNFDFDYIFPEDIQQEDVYDMVGKPLVEEVLKGYNATVFAYGQTGCLDPETNVIMFDGTFKKAKDIVLGDLLMGDDSEPRKVLKLYSGEDEMYTVIPSKGKPYKVNSSHILTLCKDNLRNIHWDDIDKVYEVQWLENGVLNKYRDTYEKAVEFYRSLGENNNLIDIPIVDYMKSNSSEYLGIRSQGIDFPYKEIPLDPYILGLWLGGDTNFPEIENIDLEILPHIYDGIKKIGLEIIQKECIVAYDTRYLEGMFYSFLSDNNLLNNKHIPFSYKINSREVRLRLLAGIIDSNGYLENGTVYCFTQKSEKLAEDLEYLCQSLGLSYSKIKTTFCKDKKITDAYYRCSIYGKGLDQIPIITRCKKITNRSIYKDDLTTTIKVVHSGRGKYNGWSLDGNGRFLLSDFTITHNSGKTTTMTGYSNCSDSLNSLNSILDTESIVQEDVKLWVDPKDMGVVPRFIQDVFKAVKTKKEYDFSVQISYVEIYLEKIRDLLNPIKDNLEIRESRYRGLWIDEVTEIFVGSFDEAIKVIRKGEQNRTVAATAMNAHSSRSHSVLTINLTQTNVKTQDKTISRIVFVDLAGSEKAEKTKVDGLILKQAQATNKSLLTLGIVIRALVEKKAHIPYRDSKLTRLLTDSLGGNSKTHLILTCSPAIYNVEETISTLRFGNTAQQIKNKPRVNLELNIEEYKRRLCQSNEKISTQQIIIEGLQKDLHKLIALCEIHKIDVKSFKKEYALCITEKNNNETHEESLERFQQLNNEIENKTSLISELQKTISSVREEMEKFKDDTEILRDDLDQRRQDIETKSLEIEVLTNKHTELLKTCETLHKQLEEQKICSSQSQTQSKLEKDSLQTENEILKQRISQLIEENHNLFEKSLSNWKDTKQSITQEESISSSVPENCNVEISSQQPVQDMKQLLESRNRHIKVLEQYINNSSKKIQDIIGNHKRTCGEYDKKIKTLESQQQQSNSVNEGNIGIGSAFLALKY